MVSIFLSKNFPKKLENNKKEDGSLSVEQVKTDENPRPI